MRRGAWGGVTRGAARRQVTAFVTWCLFGIQEIGLFIEHCALDHGAIFMDAAIEQITADVLEAIEPDDEWAPPPAPA